MKLHKLALAAAFFPLLASCAPEQNGAQADTAGATINSPVAQKAEKGDVAAQVALGDMYRLGEGVPQDYAQAVNWFRKAAEQGDAGAQTMLGYAYYSAKGVPQDYSQAVNWYRKAAEQGNASAQGTLGRLHAAGEGLPQDEVLAYAWSNLAAAQGNDTALKGRQLLADRLSPTQLDEAQRLSSNWQKGQSIQREKQ